MIAVMVRVVGGREAKAKFDLLSAKFRTFDSAFENIGDYFRLERDIEFALGAWKPLSPITVYLRDGTSHPLVRFGNLKRSWGTEGSKGNINLTMPQSAKFGSKYSIYRGGRRVPIAAIHQTGTSDNHVPARPVTLLSKEMEMEILDQVVDHLFGGWK
jgi:phage gpG-like protein